MFQEHADVLELYAGKDVADLDSERLYSTFRDLRNLCTTGEDIQSTLCRNDLFNNTVIIIDKMIKGYDELLLPPLKQGLQFIYNLSVNNDHNKTILWAKFSYLKNWMSFEKEVCMQNYVCGTLFNVVLNSKFMFEALNDVSLMDSIVNCAVKGIDFSLLFIENIFRCKLDGVDHILPKLFAVESSNHLYLLNLLHEYLKENEIDKQHIIFIKLYYQRKIKNVTFNRSELQEIFVLLKILLEISIKEDMLPILQNDTELLDETKRLLEIIHIEGKNKESEFAPTEDIFPERTESENLKANLIRLIANVCWKNRTLQDRIRETGGLPLILDSCMRDGKNPFITETAVFAIRNICECNIDNQNVIRNLNCEVHDEIVERMQNRSCLYIPN